jgi:hypothetical protein
MEMVGPIMIAIGGFLFIFLGKGFIGDQRQTIAAGRDARSLALRASFGNAAKVSDPLLLTDEHLLGGLRIYQDNCAKCRGMPGRPAPLISKGMFPPPQLFEKGENARG